ncbi:hypothetical protein [Brucella inopinata]|uniref:Alpha/beta hydrolase n=1 Tax=Brucella inopinata TaxID=1218315 RepID=A0AAW7B8R9_9HYPH|nr:hypothetical protein [Brucella inopinata]KEY03715.1 hypothetical protein IL59_0214890 [Brucella suis bv. 4 str. 40]MDL2332946.1 hypothetical protein [Brucella inopinata]
MMFDPFINPVLYSQLSPASKTTGQKTSILCVFLHGFGAAPHQNEGNAVFRGLSKMLQVAAFRRGGTGA